MDTRRATVALWLAAATAPAWAGPVGPQNPADAPKVKGTYRGVITAVKFDISRPLRELAALPKPAREEEEEEEDQRDRPSGLEGPLGPQTPDGAAQSRVGGGEIPTPSVSFDTFSNQAGFTPPDSIGDVGPNHYVVMSNVAYAVYAKTGGAPLLGPINNNTLWAGFGGNCETQNAGDPVVLHDQLADRWILTQFTSAGTTFFNCVAVSQTADPTGAYFRWAFPTGGNFPDYPKYGVWPDALYISTREFLGTSGPFQGVGAYAVNRAQLVAGNPAAQMISFLVPPTGAAYNTGDGILPADIDGTTLPPPGSPHYWVGSMDQGGPYGAPQDALTLWRYVADFVTPANSSFTLSATLPIAPYDTIFPCPGGGRRCIAQPGATNTQLLDILAYRQRPMHRLAYRNFGDHEALVTNQSVEAGAGPSGAVAGIRWWEIRSPGATPVVFQEGTFAPGLTDGIHRWMGSIAMDRAGNMALGYSASAATVTFPSSFYTGRLATDAAGTMPQGEGSFVNGAGIQTSTGNRWGDYASMNIDPVDDCTFWFITEYYPTTTASGWRLRVGAFRFPAPQCIPVPVELQSFEIKD